MTGTTSETFALAAMPAFIRAIPEAGKHRFKFWTPHYSWDEQRDFATGQAHFEAAVAFAQAGRFQDLLAMIVGGMISTGAGPMERGFLRALVEKATYGRMPAPTADEDAQAALMATTRTMEELRYGEEAAREYLDMAREVRAPEVVEWIMVDIVNGEITYGALTFIWTVCRAAYAGNSN